MTFDRSTLCRLGLSESERVWPSGFDCSRPIGNTFPSPSPAFSCASVSPSTFPPFQARNDIAGLGSNYYNRPRPKCLPKTDSCGRRLSPRSKPAWFTASPLSQPYPLGIILIWKPIVVSFGRQQIEQPATARAGKHAKCQFPMWSSGVRVESRRLKSRPVASTGVHGTSC